MTKDADMVNAVEGDEVVIAQPHAMLTFGRDDVITKRIVVRAPNVTLSGGIFVSPPSHEEAP